MNLNWKLLGIVLILAGGLTIVRCSNDDTIFGGGFGSIIVCDPLGVDDVDGPLDIDSSVTVFDLFGVAFEGQPVDVEFGSAVTVADNLTNGGTMDLNGDTGTTDDNGDLELRIDCSELDNDQNPCSVEYITTVEGNTRNCSVTFVD